jgi:hypothetical protein
MEGEKASLFFSLSGDWTHLLNRRKRSYRLCHRLRQMHTYANDAIKLTYHCQNRCFPGRDTLVWQHWRDTGSESASAVAPLLPASPGALSPPLQQNTANSAIPNFPRM